MSQKEIAEKSGLAQQTISSWKKKSRRPGYYAIRKIIKLAEEAGIDLKAYGIEKPGMPPDISKKNEKKESLDELIKIFNNMSPEKKKEIIDFAKFKNFKT